MTAEPSCIDRLRGYIERSDRAELAEAQAAIIQHALAAPDTRSRSEAMGQLQTELAESLSGIALQPSQAAYHAVIEAMIDRTREAVLDVKPRPDGG